MWLCMLVGPVDDGVFTKGRLWPCLSCTTSARRSWPLTQIVRFRVVREHGPPAVHRHGGAVDEARVAGKKVSDGGRDLGGPAHPPDRMEDPHLVLDPRGRRRLLLAQERLVTFRGDRAERHGVDPDAARA